MKKHKGQNEETGWIEWRNMKDRMEKQKDKMEKLKDRMEKQEGQNGDT